MPGFPITPYSVLSFKGGLTDQPSSADKNQYMRADNLLLTKEENPFSRPGSNVYLPAYLSLPGSVRVNYLFNYKKDTDLLAFTGAHAYAVASVHGEIDAAPGHGAFPTAAASTHFQAVEWKNHVYVTNSAGLPPMAFYPNAAGNWTARQMGLPPIPLTANYTASTALTTATALANDLLTKMGTHFANTYTSGGHSLHLLADGNATPFIISQSAASTLPQLLTLTWALMQAFMAHQSDAYQGTPVVHRGTAGVPPGQPDDWKLVSMIPPVDLPTAQAALADLKIAWNEHVIYGPPIHYASLNDSTTTTSPQGVALTAGPTVTRNISPICQLANALAAQYSAHVLAAGASPLPHTVAPTVGAVTYPTFVTAVDYKSLVQCLNQLMISFAFHEIDSQYTGSWIFHRGQTISTNLPPYAAWNGNATGPNSVTVLGYLSERHSSLADAALYLKNLITVFNGHDRDGGAHGSTYTPGTYALNSLVPTVGSYLYAFHYDYIYTVIDRQFEVAGPVLLVLCPDQIDPSYSSTSITNIPSIANTSTTNYDSANTTVKVYRTQVNQQALSLLAIVPNGTTSYLDATADVSLQTNLIYTSGGVPNADAPPNAKFIARVGDNIYYGNFVGSDGTTYQNRIVQCSTSAPENAPGSFYADLPLPLTGMIGIKDTLLIAWTGKATYRLTQGFDIQGRGTIQRDEITASVGLAAGYSPVKLDDGCVFFGTDGIYFCDGYQVHRLSRHWTTSYLALVKLNPDNIQGAFHNTERRVYWAIQTPGGATDVNACLALDLNHDPTNTENAVFTTWSNGTHFAPSSLTVFNSQLMRGDPRGYVFNHDPSFTADPRVDVTTAPANWYTVPVIYDWISVSFNFDNPRERKQVFRIFVEAKNLGTNLFLQINSNNDDGKQFAALFPIHFTGAPKVAGPDTVRGVLQFGNYTPDTLRGQVKEWRRFPAGHLRCDRKQLQFTNAWAEITNSDLLGEVSIVLVSGVPTCILSSGNWPIDTVDQILYVATDNFTQPYQVLTQSNAAITTTNPSSRMVAASNIQWKLFGYAKDQKFQLVNYTLNYYVPDGAQFTDGQEGGGDLS